MTWLVVFKFSDKFSEVVRAPEEKVLAKVGASKAVKLFLWFDRSRFVLKKFDYERRQAWYEKTDLCQGLD